MRLRGLILVLVWLGVAPLVGCSTVPVVDICDNICPGRLYPNKVVPYGGTCIPQGVSFQATTPTAPFGGVVPPPVPVPLGPAPVPPPPIGPPTIPPLPTTPPPGGAAPGAVVPVPPAPTPMFPSPKS